MEELDDVEIQKLLIREENFKNLKWATQEDFYQQRSRFRSKLLKDHEVPISKSILIKFKRSCFGIFLDSLNSKQQQDKCFNDNKLGITKWNMKNFTREETEIFNENNNAVDDLFSLLIKAVEETDCITWEFLYGQLVTLRIVDSHATVLDKELLNFKNLKVLVISNNWIEKLRGKYLPRELQFLEAYANVVSDFRHLCKEPPEKLFHLGLGRNKLTNGSNFSSLEQCGAFNRLRTLDLSDNDIYNLKDVLEELKGLTMLSALQLEGNPCATCFAYKDAVLTTFPQLIYLDNIEILKKDRKVRKIMEKNLNSAALTFTCHRIMGLPPPPKEKGLIQTIHLEVSLPLLEEINIEPPKEPSEEQITPSEKGSPTSKKGSPTKKETTAQGSKKSGNKAPSTPSPYEAEDEYAKEIKLKLKNTSFKTERLPWAKIMQYPEKAITAESPEGNLTMIRDTFRSSVNVKVVYLKVEPPAKPKKGTDKKKPNTANNEEVEEPKETILQKVTLANFYCDLHSVNWSDKTIDFYWAAHPKSNPKAIPVEGSLRAINYVEGKGNKKDEKVVKPQDGDQEVQRPPSRESVPNLFTCQVGFGLKRSFPIS